MRKLALLMAVFFVCLLATDAFAGGSGNCVLPLKKTTKHVGIGAAFEYNYVHQRYNKLSNEDGPRDMKVSKVSQVYGKGIIGLTDYINLYGKVGGSNYDLEFIDRPMSAKMKIDLDDGIYTGAGINGVYPITEGKNFSLGVALDMQGSFFINDVSGITRSDQTAISVGGAFYGIDGSESLSLVCRYNIESVKTSIIPYIGAYHSWVMIGTVKALSYQTASAGYVDDKHYNPAFDVTAFGVVVGIDLDIAEYVNLNIEGRMVGETAVTTGATIKFKPAFSGL